MKNCVLLPAVGKQNATFSPNFTQPGKVLLVQPCRCPHHTGPTNRPTHFAIVRPDDEWLPRGAPRDDAGDVERGALAQEHLARTQNGRLGC